MVFAFLERGNDRKRRPDRWKRLDERNAGSENCLPDEEEPVPGILVTSPVVHLLCRADLTVNRFIKLGTTVEKG
jgi:hypothetical protein